MPLLLLAALAFYNGGAGGRAGRLRRESIQAGYAWLRTWDNLPKGRRVGGYTRTASAHAAQAPLTRSTSGCEVAPGFLPCVERVDGRAVHPTKCGEDWRFDARTCVERVSGISVPRTKIPRPVTPTGHAQVVRVRNTLPAPLAPSLPAGDDHWPPAGAIRRSSPVRRTPDRSRCAVR